MERRKESWELLSNLKREQSAAWLMFGDFNEIMYSWEMKGKRTRRKAHMRDFREVLADYELSDLS